MNLQGKVAVITGSATGIGRAAALGFSALGCSAVINYRSRSAAAEEVADRCRAAGAEALVVPADVSNDAECRKLMQAAIDCFGRIDILVNNAATTDFVDFADLEGLTGEHWERVFRANVFGTFYCTRAAVPHMRKAEGGGAVVNVASTAGILGTGSSIAYAASKAAVINMTKSLARTLAPEIRVNAVAPGPVDTGWLREGLGAAGYQSLNESVHRTAPLRRIAPAEDVADAIIWLAGGAAMTTGEIIQVDGGIHLGQNSGFGRR